MQSKDSIHFLVELCFMSRNLINCIFTLANCLKILGSVDIEICEEEI